MLEVLAHAEEVACEVVVKQKVLDVGGNGIGSLGGVVLEAGAIAYFGVEHLTGGKGFVRFYQVDDVEGHKVEWHPTAYMRGCRERIVGVISPSSLNTGFGSVKAAEARALGRFSTELKISCSIILWVVVPQNYGASMWGEKTLIRL